MKASDINYSKAYTTQPESLREMYRKASENFPLSFMMVSPLQGSFLTSLVRMCKARRVLDIGTLRGYSAACMAEGLKQRGDGAKVVTLDIDEQFQKIAKENVEATGYSDFIEFLLGDASVLLETLDNSIPYDLIFIDANKEAYIRHYETILERNLLSDDGIIVADNVLFHGDVSKYPHFSSVPPEIRNFVDSMHKFNEHVSKDPRTTQTLLPLFDGLMLIQKVI